MNRPELALGTAQLAQEYGVANEQGPPDVDRAMSFLRAAYEADVTLWDTAPVYGRSEQLIGRFTGRISRRPRIATKLPAPAEGDELPRGRKLARRVRLQAKRSLEALSVDEIDYYLVHDPGMVQSRGEDLAAALRALREEGLVDRVGASVYSPDEALAWLDLVPGSALQLPCNVFDRRFTEVLDSAATSDTFVFGRSVFLQGLIFLEPEAAEEVVRGGGELVSVLRAVAQQAGRSVVELVLCYVRDMVNVDAVVVGMETEEQLEENLRSYRSPSLSKSVRERLAAAFGEVPERVVDPRRWESV